jgi:hypothetical protein
MKEDPNILDTFTKQNFKYFIMKNYLEIEVHHG